MKVETKKFIPGTLIPEEYEIKMIDDVKRAGIKCEVCGYELLVTGDIVFCQKCNKRVLLK